MDAATLAIWLEQRVGRRRKALFTGGNRIFLILGDRSIISTQQSGATTPDRSVIGLIGLIRDKYGQTIELCCAMTQQTTETPSSSSFSRLHNIPITVIDLPERVKPELCVRAIAAWLNGSAAPGAGGQRCF